MAESYELVIRLTTQNLPDVERFRALREFASANGWNPSDQLSEYRETRDFASGHLLVEHGLANTAVISFLKSSKAPFKGLSSNEQRRLLSISYNNLVDWHLFPDPNGLTIVYNRTDPPRPQYISRADQVDLWTAEAFDRITGKRPSANVKALDNALIETVSYWKRALSAELEAQIKNEEISALFNTIILVRALEDYRLWTGKGEGSVLLDLLENGSVTKPSHVLGRALKKLDVKSFPTFMRQAHDQLAAFDDLDRETVRHLFQDFYRNRNGPYEYDFFLISKHAMSRIYEHYVSVLRESESDQLRLFRDLPEEESNRGTGGVYTPQFIARFFARFVKENVTPKKFRALRSADPACGSGIFLRTVLEMQCDPSLDGDFRATTDHVFKAVLGVDVDPNACEATRLSLSLLHLVLRGNFPKHLRVVDEEAIKYITGHPRDRDQFDAVFANPPFIPHTMLKTEMQDRIADYMGEHLIGRADMYLAILKVGLAMVKPGGFALYVLPHSFLIADNAARLRQTIAGDFWIRVLVDLSEIPVFGKLGAYVVLLVLERKTAYLFERPSAKVVICRDSIRHALQAALEGRNVKTDLYQVFDADQSEFERTRWNIYPPSHSDLLNRLARFPTIDTFLVVRKGSVTGADDVFVAQRGAFSAERKVWLPLLTDREMLRYNVPTSTESEMFYPFIDGKKIDEKTLRDRFPETWKHLKRFEKKLELRGSVNKGSLAWWMPERPRPPQELLRPKIVSPQLVVLPKFSLDAEGKFAIRQAPLLYPREQGDDLKLLSYFLGVLNSSVGYWQVSNLSHKFSRGYSKLEPTTLQGIRVPDPKSLPAATLKRLLSLVQDRLQKPKADDLDLQIDMLVAEIYGITDADRAELGIDH
jgi:hypothetical protein